MQQRAEGEHQMRMEYADITASGHSRQHNGNVINNYRYEYTLRKRRSDETLRESQRNDVLLRASGEGQTPRVNYLIRLGVDLDHSDEHDFTALHHAAFAGFEDVCEILIAAGADVNARSLDCGMPLHIAALKGRANVVDLLLRHRARSGASSRLLGSPLHCAAYSENRSIVERLLEYHHGTDNEGFMPDVAARLSVMSISTLDAILDDLYSAGPSKRKLWRTPVIGITIWNGDLEATEKLLQHVPDIDVIRLFVWTTNSLNYVLAEDESNASLYENYTLLGWAAACRRANTIDRLLSKGAKIDDRDAQGQTALHKACQGNAEACTRVLIDAGAEIDLQDTSGFSPLHYACWKDTTQCMSLLIEAGADVNIEDDNGATPLIHATSWGHNDIVKALINRGAHLDQESTDGETALLIAAQEGYTACVKTLVEAGSNVDIQDHHDGWAPLMIAAYGGHNDIVKALVGEGAHLDLKSKAQFTALMHAVREEHSACVLTLIEAGADLHLITHYGTWALDDAASKGNVSIAKILLDAGAHPECIEKWSSRDGSNFDASLKTPMTDFLRSRGVKFVEEHKKRARH